MAKTFRCDPTSVTILKIKRIKNEKHTDGKHKTKNQRTKNTQKNHYYYRNDLFRFTLKNKNTKAQYKNDLIYFSFYSILVSIFQQKKPHYYCNVFSSHKFHKFHLLGGSDIFQFFFQFLYDSVWFCMVSLMTSTEMFAGYNWNEMK